MINSLDEKVATAAKQWMNSDYLLLIGGSLLLFSEPTVWRRWLRRLVLGERESSTSTISLSTSTNAELKSQLLNRQTVINSLDEKVATAAKQWMNSKCLLRMGGSLLLFSEPTVWRRWLTRWVLDERESSTISLSTSKRAD